MFQIKSKHNIHNPHTKTQRTHYSDEYWRKLSKYTLGYKNNKRYRASEPCPSIGKFSSYYTEQDSSSSTIWPRFSNQNSVSNCQCSCHQKVINPMLKIGQYIDKLLKDAELLVHDTDECKNL
ncbi:unnamed protein product [Diatraea saccharalis]|uniref:Uncharacterized protein n=1 Tax=Diatraea saccharalis TaxID=40085 RepID=A0A9N9QZ85_9NEOP|nr:unnamed protein product [Diatraea saccharalis]